MPLTENVAYVLPSGAVIEIENLPAVRRGAQDAAAPERESPIPFANVIEPLGEVCGMIFERISAAVSAPDTVQVELSASLKGKTTFVIVSGETQGTLKVTLSWKKNPAT